jgi:hypothetical protein
MTAGQTTNEMTRWKLHMYACAGNTKLARKRGRNTHIKRSHDDPNPTDIPPSRSARSLHCTTCMHMAWSEDKKKMTELNWPPLGVRDKIVPQNVLRSPACVARCGMEGGPSACGGGAGRCRLRQRQKPDARRSTRAAPAPSRQRTDIRKDAACKASTQKAAI